MTASAQIRVLILEDNPSDADLMVDALVQAGLDPSWERVDDPADFADRLTPGLGLILSDYALPRFTGLQALQLVRSRGLDVPFILVSGSIGEEIAVEAMRSGADDYLLKDRMARLGLAVLQALEKRHLRTESNRAELALRESEERFRQLTENILEVFYLTNAAGTEMLYVNAAYEDIWGRSRESLYAQPHSRLDAIHPDDRARVVENFTRGLTVGRYDFEYQIVRPDESLRWIHDRGFPIRGDDGRLHRIAGIAEDITERTLQTRKIEKLSRIRAVMSEINAAIVRIRGREALLEETCRIASEHGKFELVWVALLDPEKQEVRPVAWAGLSAKAARAVTWASIAAAGGTLGEALSTCRPAVRNDIEVELPTGKLRQEALNLGCRSTVCLPLVVDDKVVAAINLFATGRGFFDKDELALLDELAADVSFALQSISQQEQVEYLAYYDTLTGLPNRSLFIDRLGQQMNARGDESQMIALILFDLERFRNINESFGAHGGDDLLKLVARRLEDAFRGKDCLARIGGDVFGVLIRGVRDAADVAHALENQVFDCFREPFTVGGKELRAAARASVALYPADGGDAATLFKNAEAALKKAKNSGERYLFYAAEMNARAAHALSLETRLRKAVEARQFVLHYQPKIELAGRTICGLEALIRWQDPASGLVRPGDFIPMLEETGLIVEVGRWALARALADHREWAARGFLAPRIAVNVSAIQLHQRDFTDLVFNALQQAGASPEALELEITETLLMRDVDSSIRKLSILRSAGIHVAMDDFGTGYSSLSYIARLPINSVKIDRSFIAGMIMSPQDRSIVTTIIALSHSLNLRAVAEGVETEEQAQSLSQLKCDEAQGFLFSKPLCATDIESKLIRQR